MLRGKQRRHLRALAHGLKPVVHVGQRGLTARVVTQVDRALTDHELIKVKLAQDCPIDRDAAAERLVEGTGCEIAAIVGRVLTLYRPHPDAPVIVLP